MTEDISKAQEIALDQIKKDNVKKLEQIRKEEMAKFNKMYELKIKELKLSLKDQKEKYREQQQIAEKLQEEAKDLNRQNEELIDGLASLLEKKHIPNRKLIVDLSKSEELIKFKEICKMKLPEMTRVLVNELDKEPESFNAFLNKAFPEKCKLLCLNSSYRSIYSPLVDISPYMQNLTKCLPKVWKEASFWNFKINCSQFESLMKACKNTEMLSFKVCQINLDNNIDLDDTIDYKIKVLNFLATGNKQRSNWKSNKHRLENIVKAI